MHHFDLIIIGGGPAGLAAAATAINAHLNFTLVSSDIGGKTNYGFALRDLPGADAIWGTEFVRELEAQLSHYPERYLAKRVSEVEREANGFRVTLVGAQGVEQSIRARAIIVGTGAEPRRLYIEGEDDYIGRGLSYSTVSHARYMQGRDVAVIGLGPRVITAALQLGAIANHVYLIPTMALPTSDQRMAQIMNLSQISLLDGWAPQRFAGDEFLKQVVMTHERSFRALDVDAAFVELGLIPTKDFIRKVVKLDPETGQIPINQHCETEVEGLFAAGDVTNVRAEQIPVAVGEGVKAALSAWEYLASTSK